jgi:hypothetical protein
MSTDPTPLDPAAAVALVAAAAGAITADQAPNAAVWERLVRERADVLLRIVPAVVERSAVLAACRPVTGVIVSVTDVSGRAVIVTRPTMGTQDKPENFRTPWLNEPAGSALATLARSLIGRHCRLGKRVEATADGQKKVGMVEWIEDLGPDPEAPASRFTATAPAGPRVDDLARSRHTANAAPPCTADPFDEDNELLAGPMWARAFESAMTGGHWDRKVIAAVIAYATGGRTRDARAVLKTDVPRVVATHQALDAGRLTGVLDVDAKGQVTLVEVPAAAGGPGPGRAA